MERILQTPFCYLHRVTTFCRGCWRSSLYVALSIQYFASFSEACRPHRRGTFPAMCSSLSSIVLHIITYRSVTSPERYFRKLGAWRSLFLSTITSRHKKTFSQTFSTPFFPNPFLISANRIFLYRIAAMPFGFFFYFSNNILSSHREPASQQFFPENSNLRKIYCRSIMPTLSTTIPRSCITRCAKTNREKLAETLVGFLHQPSTLFSSVLRIFWPYQFRNSFFS